MGFFVGIYMRVCKKMVIYLGIKTSQSRKERMYTWQKNPRIWCSRNYCKYTWEKTARISCHNFETNGRPTLGDDTWCDLFVQCMYCAWLCHLCGGLSVTTWNYTNHNLRSQICVRNFSWKRSPVIWLPWATTKSLHFGWSLTEVRLHLIFVFVPQ